MTDDGSSTLHPIAAPPVPDYQVPYSRKPNEIACLLPECYKCFYSKLHFQSCINQDSHIE